jgi:hypothetical protein
MPFFKMRMTADQGTLGRLRELPVRFQRNVRRQIVTVIGPELQKDVDQLMTREPGPVSSPFAFGSPKSMAYWFFLVTLYPELTDGEHYIRTGADETGFRVEVSDRFRENQITIRNIQDSEYFLRGGFPLHKAKYVYGPWQVQGHKNTGWGREFETLHAQLQEKARTLIRAAGRLALAEAKKGRDL